MHTCHPCRSAGRSPALRASLRLSGHAYSGAAAAVAALTSLIRSPVASRSGAVSVHDADFGPFRSRRCSRVTGADFRAGLAELETRFIEVRKALTAAAMVTVLVFAAAPADAGQREAPDSFVVEPIRGQNVDDELGPCGNRWNNTRLRWRTAHYPHFTLCHGGASERDMGVVARALRRALRVGRTKYGVRRPMRKGEPIYVDVFMYPREAGRISRVMRSPDAATPEKVAPSRRFTR